MSLSNVHRRAGRNSAAARGQRQRRSALAHVRPAMEDLEERVVPAYVFVDFGDNFPLSGASRILTTTVGAVRDVAVAQRDNNNNAIPNTVIPGPQLKDATRTAYPDSTAVRFTPFANTAAQRAALIANASRAFAAVNVTVVALTAAPQTLADGRVVAAAASLANVASTLRGNNTTTNDVYVIVARPAIGSKNDNPNKFATNAYGGTSPGNTVLGEKTDLSSSFNNHDDLVLNFRNDANTIVHEAGHALGLQHGVTTAAPAKSAIDNVLPTSEVMSYLSTESSFFFSRYPMVRGDSNTDPKPTFLGIPTPPPLDNNDLLARQGQQTPFDQLRVDPNVGENPNLHFISGTGANDIIRISKGAGNTANVVVAAFDDTKYKKPILVPGTINPLLQITTYSYTVSLDRPLLVQAGLGDDQIILDGNLNTQVTVDGGDATDTDAIIVDDGANLAAFTYTVTSATVTRNTGFGLTYSNAENLTLITGPSAASPSTVNVQSSLAATPVTITGSGNPRVNVGKVHSTQGIAGDVIVSPSGSGKPALSVDASADLGGTIAVTNRSLTGLGVGTATIIYSPKSLSALAVSTGYHGNTITVKSTPAAPVTLKTGIDRDVINVRATNGPLSVDGQSGADAIVVGESGNMQGIGGPLSVTNASGYSEIILNDFADKSARTVIVYNNGSSTVISGLTTQGGDISLGRDDVSALTIFGGVGGNTFRIHDTLPRFFVDGNANHFATTLTSVSTGAGADTVTVDGTTGALALDVQGAGQGTNAITVGSPSAGLGGINGSIDVTGATGVANSLSIRDAGSTVGRDYVIDAHFVQRLDKARIGYEHLSDLLVEAGARTDHLVVQDTMPVAPGRVTRIASSGGDDVIDVSRTTGSLVIDAGGSSVINVGSAVSALDNIRGSIGVLPSGAGSAVTLFLDDEAATTAQQLDVGPGVLATSFRRSGAAEIQVVLSPLARFEWHGGSGGNTVNVKAQPAADSVFTMGDGGDVLNDGTAANTLVAGSVDVGALTVIGGQGADQLLVRDQGTTAAQHYELYVSPVAGLESRGTIRAQAATERLLNWRYVVFDQLEAVRLDAGSGGNSFKIAGTPAATSVLINTGANGDTVDVGSFAARSSLADIRGPLVLDGQGGLDRVTFSDQGTSAPQYYPFEADRLTRTDANSVADMAPISFAGLEAVALNGSSGGSVVFVGSTAAGTTTTVNGQPGAEDTFTVGFGLDLSAILGPVHFFGQSADGDFAYYYDYLNANPRAYDFHTDPLSPATLVVECAGLATVTYGDLVQVIFYAPVVGGSAVNVEGVPAQAFLNMLVGNGDTVTLGTQAPDLGGTLANIRGPVAVTSYASDDAVALVLDDSGNGDTTPKKVRLTPRSEPDDAWDHVEGFAPAAVHWRLGANASVALLGGAADESFALASTTFAAAIAIDGGGGVNTLDYSMAAESQGVTVNLQRRTATGIWGGINNIQNVIGSAGDDILVGDGGNVLDGGLGRDLLIAGPSASILRGGEDEDILIGGTTDHDDVPEALEAILAEWASASDYATRVADLESGSNGAPILSAATVRSNGGGNTLSGSEALDLFFANIDLDTLDEDPAIEELVSV